MLYDVLYPCRKHPGSKCKTAVVISKQRQAASTAAENTALCPQLGARHGSGRPRGLRRLLCHVAAADVADG